MTRTRITESDVTDRKERQAARMQGPGRDPMGRGGIAFVATYIVLFSVAIIYALVVLWPPVRSPEVKKRLDDAVKERLDKRRAAEAKREKEIEEAEARQKETELARTRSTTTVTQPASPTNTNANTNTNSNTNRNTNTNTNTNANTAVAASSPATQSATQQSETGCVSGALIEEGFCLDNEGRPREGIGALRVWGCWRCIYDEDRLLLIVLLSGALGALVHAIRSLSWYVGNRRCVWSWSAMYFMLPFLGAGIAFIFYLVIRGGFFSPTSTVSDTSPFGFAALAALIGMFTEPAVIKLRKVATTILEPPEQGKDHVGPAPTITEISPNKGRTKGGEEIKIVGTNFATDVAVSFGGVEADVTASTPTLITVNTPEHIAGKVDVVVTNEDKQQAVSKDGFEYIEPPPPPGGDGEGAGAGGAGAGGAGAGGAGAGAGGGAAGGAGANGEDETDEEGGAG